MPPFATELEFVAGIVDRPGAVGGHQYAALDTADQLLQGLLAGFDVEVSHAVDGRPIPAAGAAAGSAGEPAAPLGKGAPQRVLEDALLDDQDLLGRRAIVVEGVAGQLLGKLRIEADVEQGRSIDPVAEIFRLDEAGAGIVAFVAKDTVHFQRVTDGLVDLQDHLVRQ
ncbi:hypothetical protein X778_18925 [Pseudomonas aeruginosa VRFPA07]|nr:hypothetical protein X778_18925 [Pseudomonas aeruginosa VRFPA07]